MLRTLIIILIIYIVIRITLRLLLTESPSRRRSRVNSQRDPFQRSGSKSRDETDRFNHVEDAEFEEIPKKSEDKKS